MPELSQIKEVTTLALVIPLTFIVGLYFSFKLAWPQFRLIRTSCAMVLGSRREAKTSTPQKETPSTLAAISAVLGGNLGTGNIAGIAVALSMGGPGALFWMWVMALIAAIFKFTECYLSLQPRFLTQHQRTKRTLGGPIYYIKALKPRAIASPLRLIYSIALIAAAYGVGNMVQVQSLALPLEHAGASPLLVSCALSLLTLGVSFGGLRLFYRIVVALVPLMATIYIISCLIVIGAHLEAIPAALQRILLGAFNLWGPSTIGYGVMGGLVSLVTSPMARAMQVGFDRGLFATDAGSGLAGILHAPVTEKHAKYSLPLSQALASLISPLIVVLICTLTGLVILISGVDPSSFESTNLCVEAFNCTLGGIAPHLLASLPLGSYLVTTTLFFFAFTTILTWSRCAEETLLLYFDGPLAITLHRFAFAALIALHSFWSVGAAWQMADLALNMMLICNLIATILLRRSIPREI